VFQEVFYLAPRRHRLRFLTRSLSPASAIKDDAKSARVILLLFRAKPPSPSLSSTQPFASFGDQESRRDAMNQTIILGTSADHCLRCCGRRSAYVTEIEVWVNPGHPGHLW
jgi:hypothetical protein